MDVDYLIQYTLLELVCNIFVFGLLIRIFLGLSGFPNKFNY